GVRRWELKPSSTVAALAFSPDGALLAAALQTAPPARDKDWALILEVKTGRRVVLKCEPSDHHALAFDPSGKRLAWATDATPDVVFADAATGAVGARWDVQTKKVRKIAFLDKGTQVLLAFEGTASLQVRDAATGRVLREAAGLWPDGLVDCALSRDGGRLAVATAEGDLHVLAVPGLQRLGHHAKAHP